MEHTRSRFDSYLPLRARNARSIHASPERWNCPGTILDSGGSTPSLGSNTAPLLTSPDNSPFSSKFSGWTVAPRHHCSGDVPALGRRCGGCKGELGCLWPRTTRVPCSGLLPLSLLSQIIFGAGSVATPIGKDEAGRKTPKSDRISVFRVKPASPQNGINYPWQGGGYEKLPYGLLGQWLTASFLRKSKPAPLLGPHTRANARSIHAEEFQVRILGSPLPRRTVWGIHG